MRINHLNDRIGDTILVEPALTALAQRTGERISLYVRPDYQIFFANHPHIDLVNQPHEQPDCPDPCPSKAFAWSHRHGLPFAAGYFHQFRMAIADDRLHFALKAKPQERQDIILIAPFAKSCNSQKGLEANIMPPLAWWGKLIESSPVPVISLGDETDPLIEGTLNLRQVHFSEVLDLLSTCRVFVSVETGLLILAGACRSPTVFLSSATPIWFSKPDTRCEVVRAERPAGFDPDYAVELMHKLLRMEASEA